MKTQVMQYAMSLMLEKFPEVLKQEILKVPAVESILGVQSESLISFSGSRSQFRQTALFDAIREFFSNGCSQQLTHDAENLEWSISLAADSQLGVPKVVLCCGVINIHVLEFSLLSPESDVRTRVFNILAHQYGLPKKEISKWKDIFCSAPVSNDTFDEFFGIVFNSPKSVIKRIENELSKGEVNLPSLVPASVEYYEMLIGVAGETDDVSDYNDAVQNGRILDLVADKNAKSLLVSFASILNWNYEYGVSLSGQPVEVVEEVYADLASNGDLIAQVSSLEMGVNALSEYPQIRRHVLSIMNSVLDDDCSPGGRFDLIYSLYVFVSGELASSKALSSRPIFWRRIAAFAHASCLEGTMISMGVDLIEISSQMRKIREHLFRLQSMIDLRSEPRWMFDTFSPQQIKFKCLHRVLSLIKPDVVYDQEVVEIFEKAKTMMARQEYSSQIFNAWITSSPSEFTQPPPDEIDCVIRENLSKSNFSDISLNAMINSGSIFALDLECVNWLSKLIRQSNYQLLAFQDPANIRYLLRGISHISAMYRHADLSKDVCVLIRKHLLNTTHKISIEDAVFFGLIASSAFESYPDWSKSVGSLFADLAFSSVENDFLERLQGILLQLCELSPKLWVDCGVADAALSAILHP